MRAGVRVGWDQDGGLGWGKVGPVWGGIKMVWSGQGKIVLR